MGGPLGLLPLGFLLSCAFGGDRRPQNENAPDEESLLKKLAAHAGIEEEASERLKEPVKDCSSSFAKTKKQNKKISCPPKRNC